LAAADAAFRRSARSRMVTAALTIHSDMRRRGGGRSDLVNQI
jgi:hypothetical protein